MQTAQSTTSNAERLYYSSISSPYTQRLYRTYLQKYLAFYGIKNVSELLTKDHKEVESQIRVHHTVKRKGNEEKKIVLYQTFSWFLTQEFQELKNHKGAVRNLPPYYSEGRYPVRIELEEKEEGLGGLFRTTKT